MAIPKIFVEGWLKCQECGEWANLILAEGESCPCPTCQMLLNFSSKAEDDILDAEFVE